MRESFESINGEKIKVISLDTVIVGSGAAGFNAALRLKGYGREDIAIVTEGINMGTSRNTGSDKQTYYKMNLCADYPDSPHAMAEDMISGGCVDGDIAYAEASLSVQCFLHLCELGVPFPTNRYGEYVGYKTDHDLRARATSAGPLTSKLMTECLEKAVKKENIKIYDKLQVISIIVKDGEAKGILALDKSLAIPELVLFNSANVIFATGGPAGIYESTVYPVGHNGSSGVLFESGVKGRNLTEWQYGLASIAPRWNVSGTYMQVLPRFVSVDENGNEYEFLDEFYTDFGECLFNIFKKGYEWPFDSRKLPAGSSLIDLLVYRETSLRHRKVYLDYRYNPHKEEKLNFDILNNEAFDYLLNANACFGTPIERLLKMNEPAYELYLSKGVDLKKDMLQIDLCAQHNNGGAAVDLWWQTNIKGLFVAGEAAGTHGIYRPGGSALNAGQVGSTRAAQYIANKRTSIPTDTNEFISYAEPHVEYHRELISSLMLNESNTEQLTHDATSLMSSVGGAIRTPEKMADAEENVTELIRMFSEKVGAHDVENISNAYRLRDILIAQKMYLFAMQDYAGKANMTRGSALYTSKDGNTPISGYDVFAFVPYDRSLDKRIQEVEYNHFSCKSEWRDVVSLPDGGGFFENIWAEYRKNKNIY